MQNFFGVDYPAALGVVQDLMNQRMRQFEHVVAHELPIVYDDFQLSDEARAVMQGYVTDLQNWMAGILNWHREVPRYKAEYLAGRTHGFLPDRIPAVPVPEVLPRCPCSADRRSVSLVRGSSRAGAPG